MSAPNDGGPAFPIPDRSFPNGETQWGASGMSLRDYFAGQALNSLCAVVSPEDGLCVGLIVKDCYEIADAMLAEREKRGGA